MLPHPPLLVPELVAGAAGRTEPVRAACLDAGRRLLGRAARWVAVAADPSGPRTVDPATAGTFAGFGVDVPVTLGPGAAEPDVELPLPALVAGWLRGRVGAESVRVELVPPDLPADECRRVGADLAAGPEPVGLLVLGDGSARHPDRAPGRPDPRAPEYDGRVRDALATADASALLALDVAVAAELVVGGRAAWQVLAGAALADGRRWRAELLYSDAPFGVGYHVAVWDPVD
ncbi:Catalytic LigB subunit of aromatic ring-opening dioxygenase [Streptoalloteichus tenebrarius]|uniref:Catalytic LigB subunit of aromatic ring-opening dioxygenase n=1 Tax=Streptoalloteichus tenebrarius (strain ATCC 17920 / DSM 40477 / JCM 4838 / CBS 697.72 / NBRC 16177 / NCIMB 11028 / NRRL B-12390 / A12253. 1 / ISP 5477) TaxID=1933 RepID=A0ABT1HMR5_STRSD|nr:Catalytic LigB subunit of aromatic ring-opening dioxygenase [Streptoalloteichus tenebrarius]